MLTEEKCIYEAPGISITQSELEKLRAKPPEELSALETRVLADIAAQESMRRIMHDKDYMATSVYKK